MIIKRIAAAVFACLCVLSMPACSAIDGLMTSLGFDTHDYSSEEVIAQHAPGDDVTLELAEMVSMLILNSPYLEEFDKMSEVLASYRDSVLNYMLGKEYAKYSGNLALLDEASREYPQIAITTAIPATDFEAVMYRCFGGSEKVTNQDGRYFIYLEKVSAYTVVSGVHKNSVNVVVTSCRETENTYVLTFYNTLGHNTSPEYTALIIKRSDGTLYFKSLKLKK